MVGAGFYIWSSTANLITMVPYINYLKCPQCCTALAGHNYMLAEMCIRFFFTSWHHYFELSCCLTLLCMCLPCSYDSLVPVSDLGGVSPQVAPPTPKQWWVSSRWLTDSDQFNEWMTEEDYELIVVVRTHPLYSMSCLSTPSAPTCSHFFCQSVLL